MKNIVRSLCIAGLLLGGANLLRAEDKPATPDAAPKKHTAAEALTPEQREAKLKEMKAKKEAQLKDLREKKAAGKLTELESKKLEQLEKSAAKAQEKKATTVEHKTTEAK